MNLEYILKTVKRKVQDSSYDDDDYINWINECIGQIASEENLPDLVTYDRIIIRAGEYSDSRPDDYHSGLFHAYNNTKNRKVRVFNSLTEFLEKYPGLNENGDVESIVVSGEDILGMYVPDQDQEIRIWYYREPEYLNNPNDILPSYIPRQLHAVLFVNYCCMQAYSEIEDGVGESMPNFEKYSLLYEEARNSLRTFLGVPDESPDFVSDSGKENL